MEEAGNTGYIPTGEYGTDEVDKYLKSINGMTVDKFVQKSLLIIYETAGGRIAANTKKMRKFMDKAKTLNISI